MKIRPATSEDAVAVAEVFAAVEEDALGRLSRFSEYDVRDWWVTVPLETNTWLVEDDGALVAAAGGEVRGGRGVFAGAVRPAARGRGLGTTLAELAEARLAGDGARRVHAWTVAGDEAADGLFAGRGYREVRRFWEMAIELDHEPPPPLVPVESFHVEDVRAFHAALEEAFEDHWESQPEPFERWWDAANPTGATRLYESVGMHVDQESIIWEKVVA